MEISHLARLCVDVYRLLYLDHASYRFTGGFFCARLCSVFKSTFKQSRNHYSLLLGFWIVFRSSTCPNHIQLQESFDKDSGTQHAICAISWKPRRKFRNRHDTRDSHKQIIVCCCFRFHVVLGTRLAHYHSNTPQHRRNNATKYSATMRLLFERVERHQSFHIRRNESLVPKRISTNSLLQAWGEHSASIS